MKQLHRLLIAFIALAITTHAQAQTQLKRLPYYDALTLLNSIKNDNDNAKADIEDIVSYYFNEPKPISDTRIDTLLKSNDYLKSLGLDTLIDSLFKHHKVPKSQAEAQGVDGGIMGVNVANYADGLAQFLIERGREELSMAFFNRFQSDLKRYPEIGYLFPETQKLLTNIQLNNIQALLQELRDAFIKDLQQEPAHILSLRNIDESECPKGRGGNDCKTRVAGIKNIFTQNNPEKIIIPLIVMQSMIDGDDIFTVLNKVAMDPAICTSSQEYSNYLKLSAILIQSLQGKKEGDNLFLTKDEVETLFTSEKILKTFIGLTYQKYSGITCYSIDINGKHLKDFFDIVITSRTHIYNGLNDLQKINAAYHSIKTQVDLGTPKDINTYASLLSLSVKGIDNISNALITEIKPAFLQNPDYIRARKNMQIATNVCADVQQHNYPGIFNDVINLIKTNNIFPSATTEKVVKYLSFGANMASAKSAEEVKNALNTVALPPGSYSLKQKSAYNISLNGYIGYAWDYNDGKQYASGVYAPVGISLSKGLSRKIGGALSLFVSIIDVGGIASYRLANGATDSLKQQINLGSIISPSVQALLAIPKTPIALCLGWRQTPKLYYTTSQGFQTIAPRDVLNLAILIDIPIATISNRPYQN